MEPITAPPVIRSFFAIFVSFLAHVIAVAQVPESQIEQIIQKLQPCVDPQQAAEWCRTVVERESKSLDDLRERARSAKGNDKIELNRQLKLTRERLEFFQKKLKLAEAGKYRRPVPTIDFGKLKEGGGGGDFATDLMWATVAHEPPGLGAYGLIEGKLPVYQVVDAETILIRPLQAAGKIYAVKGIDASQLVDDQHISFPGLWLIGGTYTYSTRAGQSTVHAIYPLRDARVDDLLKKAVQ